MAAGAVGMMVIVLIPMGMIMSMRLRAAAIGGVAVAVIGPKGLLRHGDTELCISIRPSP
jgi:hypothetical protein